MIRGILGLCLEFLCFLLALLILWYFFVRDYDFVIFVVLRPVDETTFRGKIIHWLANLIAGIIAVKIAQVAFNLVYEIALPILQALILRGTNVVVYRVPHEQNGQGRIQFELQ